MLFFSRLFFFAADTDEISFDPDDVITHIEQASVYTVALLAPLSHSTMTLFIMTMSIMTLCYDYDYYDSVISFIPY